MPVDWQDDPNWRKRPDHSQDRNLNPRNRMERGGGGGGDQHGCALWTLMAIGVLVALIVAMSS